MQIDSGFEEAILRKGQVLLSLRDFEQAIQYFDKILEKNPANLISLYGKATCLSSLGIHDLAISFYDKSFAQIWYEKFKLFNHIKELVDLISLNEIQKIYSFSWVVLSNGISSELEKKYNNNQYGVYVMPNLEKSCSIKKIWI